MRRRLGFLFLLLLAATTPAAAETEPVRVLAAFTLKPALDEIAAGYRKMGRAVTVVYGPSPGLAQQVENGAPGDLFFSADPMWTAELAEHRLIKPGSVTDLVGNHLVLIGKKGAAPVDIQSLAGRLGEGLIAMCDPDSHPGGRMAKASLTTLGIWNGIAKKVARAENPLLAVKMVARGDVPYAVVFTTDALADPGVAIVATLPDDSHPAIRYPVALLTNSANPDADRFLAYLRSAAATAVFRRFGYVTLSAK